MCADRPRAAPCRRRRRTRPAQRRCRPRRPPASPASASPQARTPSRSCSATPSTTRPRRSCCGWPEAAAPARCRRWPPARGSGAGRCSACGATSSAPAASKPGLPTWDDPSNADPAFARARVRAQVLPLLEADPGTRDRRVAGPQRRPAAGRRRRPGDARRRLPRRLRRAGRRRSSSTGWRACCRAVRSRVLRSAALRAGCPPTALTAAHVAALDALVTAWQGQGPLSLPGGVNADRRDGRIIVECTARLPEAHPDHTPSEARQMRR